MFKTTPETLFTDVDVVEIKCPVCGGDRVEPIEGNKWECCVCGMPFETHYEN
jgi:ribosomal protein L37AE/L43A